MTDTLPPNNCVCLNENASFEERKECMWPTNHNDKKTLCESGMIRKLPVADAKEVMAAGLGVTTRSNSAKVDDSVGESIERTNEKLLELLKDLCDGLWERVYPKESKDFIEETRMVLDLKKNWL